jgi:chromosome segregation ATPase
MVEMQKLNSKQIEGRLQNLGDTIVRYEGQIKNYNNLLINKISGTIENRKLLNSILSEQVMSLPGEQVLKKIKKITDTLTIFDGEIDISKNIKLKDFKSVEEITEELAAVKQERAGMESLLKVVSDLEKAQNELAKINEEIETIKMKLQKIKAKPMMVKAIDKLKAEINELNAQKEKFEHEQRIISKKIAQKSNELQEIVEDKKKRAKALTSYTIKSS